MTKEKKEGGGGIPSPRGVHESGWGDFWPNPLWWVKKNSTQPNPSHKSNPTQPIWVGLGQIEPVGLTIFLFIIKLSRKKYKYKYIKKTQRLISM